MIEDVPVLGPFKARLRLPVAPASVYDALSGQALDWRLNDAGQVVIDVPDLHIHRAIVLSVGYIMPSSSPALAASTNAANSALPKAR